jgi:signal transduction histidine kinase
MIGTLLRNLIANAIKFTESGGKIMISAEEQPNNRFGS